MELKNTLMPWNRKIIRYHQWVAVTYYCVQLQYYIGEICHNEDVISFSALNAHELKLNMIVALTHYCEFIKKDVSNHVMHLEHERLA